MPALTASDLERIRLHLSSLPPESLETRFGREDYLAALGVFLLVFLSLFPVAVPFLLVDDVRLALRVSNTVAVACCSSPASPSAGRWAGHGAQAS